LDETEIVTDTALDAGDPSEEDFEDYTGNAGMTLERWYHRAAGRRRMLTRWHNAGNA
jgi:hypothetical protein